MPRATLRTIAATALVACGLLPVAQASAGPASVRVIATPGAIVPIPDTIAHQEGSMIDSRILPDLRWIAAHFPIYVSEGYSGPLPDGQYVGCHGCHVKHSDHYNGLAVDIVPLHWSAECDANWRGVTRLAHWAEPVQNHPIAPFRWVGYEGDPGHGCGNHLHLSWEHAPAPEFQLAEWVDVFPVGSQEPAPQPEPQPQPSTGKAKSRSNGKRQTRSTPRRGPTGGISRAQTGGLSPGD